MDQSEEEANVKTSSEKLVKTQKKRTGAEKRERRGYMEGEYQAEFDLILNIFL